MYIVLWCNCSPRFKGQHHDCGCISSRSCLCTTWWWLDETATTKECWCFHQGDCCGMLLSDMALFKCLCWYQDLLVYGIIAGGLCLGTFAIVAYAFYGGQFGTNCNREFTDCEAIYRARAATYAALAFIVILNSFNCRSSRGFIWQFKRYSEISMMVICAVIAIATIFMSIYIPVINDRVFHHTCMWICPKLIFLIPCSNWCRMGHCSWSSVFLCIAHANLQTSQEEIVANSCV